MVDGLGRFSCSLFMMHTFFIYCLNIPICLINKERHRRCPYAKSLEQERKREERFGIVRLFLRSSEQATSGSRSIIVPILFNGSDTINSRHYSAPIIMDDATPHALNLKKV